jgi:hypothetical protein
MRTLIIFFAAIILTLGTVGCSRSNAVSYKDAVEQALQQADLIRSHCK